MSEQTAYISVEEAATRLGVSVATVRRWAASGEVEASKSGGVWVIDESSLPQPARPMPATPPVDVDLALRYVRATDLRETWVPDPLRFEDWIAASAALRAAALSRFGGTPLGPALRVEIDRTSISSRTAVLLSVADRVAYQAAVGAIASSIEAQTPDEVFSARLAADGRHFLKRGTTQWVEWRRHVLAQVKSGLEWMVKTDMTSYFDTIPHRILAAEIKSLNPDPDVERVLNDMLRTWTVVPSGGLPQGPNASRLLANLYLLPVDREMLGAGYAYSRFLDDIRIVTSTKAEAKAAARMLERACKRRGLILSSAKTALLHGDEARRDLLQDSELSTVAYFLDANAFGLARPLLKKILTRALKDEGQIAVRQAKFGLWRLAQLRESSVMGQVLARLEDMAPIATVVAAYLQPFITHKRVVKELATFLADPARAYSDYMATWLFAVMLEHPGTLPTTWCDQAAARVRDRNRPSYLRAVAAIVMARSGSAPDVAWIKGDIDGEHDPAVLRGYAIALRWANELDANASKRLVAHTADLQVTLDYLKGRADVPSLVYPDPRLRLP